MSIQLDSIYEIIILALGLAGFVWLAMRDFKKAVYLVIFLLPFYLFKVKIFFVPFNVSEILIWLLFLVWLAGRRYKLIKIDKLKKYFWPTLLILAGVGSGVLVSENLSVSAGILKGWFAVPIIFALIAALEIKKENEIKNALFWLVASSGLVGAVALFYFFAGKTTFDGRLAAFYLSPNQLAMYLAPGFLIATIAFRLANKREKILLGAAAIFSGAALYLTFSYAAWISILAVIIAVLIGNIILFPERAKRVEGFARNFTLRPALRQRLRQGEQAQGIKFRSLIVYSFLIVFSVSFIFFTQFGSEKLNNLMTSVRSSWQSRLAIWQAAWLIGKDHPIFGIGAGMFQEYYLRYQKYFSVPYLEWAVPQPHNLFLAFWLQAGLLGLFGFVWLLVIFFRQAISLIKKRNQLAMAMGLVVLYTLLHGLVDTTYFKNDLAVVFWLMAALLASLVDSFDWQKG